MRENRTQGSVRGLPGNRQSYLDAFLQMIERLLGQSSGSVEFFRKYRVKCLFVKSSNGCAAALIYSMNCETSYVWQKGCRRRNQRKILMRCATNLKHGRSRLKIAVQNEDRAKMFGMPLILF